METLICGFEAYGKRDVNNAWEVAKQFHDIPNIHVLKLPVSFGRAHKVVFDALARRPYDLILMLGETSATTDCVRLERVAINFKDSVNPDNDGVSADEEELIVDAPKAYFTAFPVKKVAAALKTQGRKVKVTNSTGTYVCNSVYFNVLHYLSEKGVPTVALFLHLPVSTDNVSLSEMTETVKELIAQYQKGYLPPD